MPPAAGLRAHVELARISGHLVHNTHRITPGIAATAEAQSQHLQKLSWLLEQWQTSLPPSLQLSADGLASDPAVGLLHMHRNQLLILAARPLFFAAVKRSFAERVVTQRSSFESHPQAVHLMSCVAAARRNMHLARHLVTLNRRGKLLHAGLHFVFDAAVCLLLHELAADETTPTEDGPGDADASTGADVDFAIQKLQEDAGFGNRLARDSADTLQHLRSLLARLKLPMDPSLVPAVMAPELLQPQMQIDATGPQGLYDDLATWMDSDWPMYEGGYLE